ncbi:MAG: hypothetical protein RIR69_1205 [Actinomycetota bacterium]|jgi:uncharacterized protein YdhG (YjbR/CyaY superfamily)
MGTNNKAHISPSGENDRAKHFPKIEEKYGRPMAYWFAQLSELGDAKYPDQISLLREKFEFTQAHANAVVMYHRGSTTTRRHDSVDELLSSLGQQHEKLTREILNVITQKFPQLEPVVAWNQPMLKYGKDYVIGISASKNHLTIGPWGNDVVGQFSAELEGLKTNKKTFQVPLNWKINKTLLHRIVQFRLNEIT